MVKSKSDGQVALGIQNLSVIELILIDHRFIKNCIEMLLDDNADRREKLSISKKFLNALVDHSVAEKKAIYIPLEKNEDLHFNILEAEIEHANILKKIKFLKPRLVRVKVLKDELAAELKNLAEMVKYHLMEEESEVLSRMREYVDDASLAEMGRHFMKLRKFSTEELLNYPHLYEELIQWKDSIQKVSSKFLAKMDKFVENMEH